MPPPFTVAILTHNALDCTQRCLASLARHTPQPHRVWILDNASSDATPRWLREQARDGLRVELGERNLGVPGGRNRLLELALPELPDDGFVVFLDNDIEVHAGWAEPFLELIASEPRVGIAGRIGHPIVVSEADRTLLPAPLQTAPVDVASGGFACWVRARAARDIGAFDENLGLFWHEDDDYCVRALAHGWEVFAVPSASMTHHEHGSGVALGDLETQGSPRNRAYLAAKWREAGWIDADGWVIRRDSPYYLSPPARRALLGPQCHGPSARILVGEAFSTLRTVQRARDPVAAATEMEQVTPVAATLARLFAENTAGELATRWRATRAAIEGHRSIRALADILLPRRNGAATSLSHVCRGEDFDDPAWRDSHAAIFGPNVPPAAQTHDRQGWEATHALFGLGQLGALDEDSCGFVLRPGLDRLLDCLAERARSIVSADLHGDLAARYDPAHPRLRVLGLDPTQLGFSDASFDFACALGVLSRLDDQSREPVLRELVRVVKPGGTIALSFDIPLDDPSAAPRTIADLGEFGLEPIDAFDAGVSDLTLTCREALSAAPARPHLVTDSGGSASTSALVFVRKSPALVAAQPLPPTARHIGLDVRCLYRVGSVARGIGHYTLHHLEALIDQRPQWRFTCVGEARESGAVTDLLRRSNAAFLAIGDYRPASFDLLHVSDALDMSMGFDAPFRVFRDELNSVTFYDLIPHRLYRETMNETTRWAYADRLQQIERCADLILAISDYTRRDALDVLTVDADRVHVIGAGLNRTKPCGTAVDTAAVRARLGLDRPFFLHVGALDPHKNFAGTLTAFLECARDRACQLAVVGRPDEQSARFAEYCRKQGLDAVVFTGFLPRAELEALYAEATALVCLSLYEGFGFPVLEGMAAGCPVLASDRTSIPEVAGDAAWLVDPENRSAVTAAMRTLLDDSSRRADLRAAGIARARQFTWQRVADATLAVWDGALAPATARAGLQPAGA